ncbi:VOC family protein [Nonomuraea muscovyensis]|uniref:Catechol 2,3-dioxygenase-like lactoylglutathione lyase family enzyme n=1 Tax=Nonomuraea muscovyensis TaxID=1124761 RepID=A0A7X0EZI8_9ACTN|nr:VOC family protein [Nonomuraea muscovyensis]MBB6349863.1 catechol 2,3-dioxygenase-like lactoylglutathione lyase family enzyme [Nonomuraea muscovyensis]
MNIVASTVVFTVDDLAGSRHFFTTHLGFREVLDTPDFTWLSRDDAAADILLHQRDLELPQERIAQPVVTFAVTDLAKEYTRLGAEDAPITRRLERNPWGERLMRMTDPNGIVVELTEWIAPSGA